MEETLLALMKMFDHPHQWYGGRTYAQHGDDLAIINIFRCLGIERPSYLDIGAHHPFHLSNTALLYSRGSRGINVEANPALIADFRRLRPEDITLHAAVVGLGERLLSSKDTVTLNRLTETSGINSLLPIPEEYGQAEDTVEVPAMTADQIVSKHCGGKWPDLLSIDAEGMDVAILQSIDLIRREGPRVICAEFVSAGGDICSQLRDMMTARGYSVHSFCGGNMLLVRTDLMEKCR